MKAFIFISTFFFAPVLKGQGIDKSYIVNWIKAADPTFPVDSVKVFIVDREYITSDDSLDNKLKQISADKIASIGFSRIKKCGYQPGRGTIWVYSVEQQSFDDLTYNLTKLKKAFVDKYASFSQHISTNTKDPVLMIDNVMINHTQIKEALKKLNLITLYSIEINRFPVPATLYGQNAKNGLVQILTKKKMML